MSERLCRIIECEAPVIFEAPHIETTATHYVVPVWCLPLNLRLHILRGRLAQIHQSDTQARAQAAADLANSFWRIPRAWARLDDQ